MHDERTSKADSVIGAMVNLTTLSAVGKLEPDSDPTHTAIAKVHLPHSILIKSREDVGASSLTTPPHRAVVDPHMYLLSIIACCRPT
jgi:hypothetical protein